MKIPIIRATRLEGLSWDVNGYAGGMTRMIHKAPIMAASIGLWIGPDVSSGESTCVGDRPPPKVDLDDHRPLIDRTEMAKWRVVGGDGEFEWIGPMIHGHKAGSRNTFLMSERQYGDFILEGEVKIDSGNSGWQIRSHLTDPRDDTSRLIGYQIEVDPSDRNWSGGLYDEGRRGWLHPLADDPAAKESFSAEDWNTYRIEAIGPRIRSWVNGTACADVLDLADLTGSIALQVHSGECEVWWRNLQITDLGYSRYVQAPEWSMHPASKEGGSDEHGHETDYVVLQPGDRAEFSQSAGIRGTSLRFEYQSNEDATLIIGTSGEIEPVLELPLSQKEPATSPGDRVINRPVIAPGGGMRSLGDEWMELVIDLESDRLVVINEGIPVTRLIGQKLSDAKGLQVAIACRDGIVKLRPVRSLVSHRTPTGDPRTTK